MRRIEHTLTDFPMPDSTGEDLQILVSGKGQIRRLSENGLTRRDPDRPEGRLVFESPLCDGEFPSEGFLPVRRVESDTFRGATAPAEFRR